MTAELIRSPAEAKLSGPIGVMLGCAIALITAPALGQEAERPIEGTIQYGYWGNSARAEVTEAVSRAFEEGHPGTKVQGNVAEYQAYIERLTVQSAAGELPCVTQTQSTFLATYAMRGVLRPLDDLVEAGAIDVSGIPEAILETGRVDGQLFMLPTGTFLRLIAYNADMVEEYGIEEPPPRGSFEEYRNWLIAAQEKLPDGIYAAENEGAELFTFYSWVAGHGENFFEDGSLGFKPELLAEFFEFWSSLTQMGVAIPGDRLDEQFGARETTPLARGHALSATADIPQIRQIEQVLANAGLPSNIEFVRNPVVEGAESGNVPGTNGLSISASCDNVATAAAYLDFFNNAPEAALAFRSSNGVVVSGVGRQALLESEETPEAVRASIETLAEVANDGDIAPASYPSGYQTLPALLRRTYEQVVLNGQDPTAAAEQFFKEAAPTLR